MSVEELKKIAYKNPDTEIVNIIDKWFVKHMHLLYMASANSILSLEDAKKFTAELEKDYRVLKLNQRINVNAIGYEIAQKLAKGEQVDFEEYPLDAEEWEQAGKIINKQMCL